MPSISSPGIGSDLPVNEIVPQLVDAERAAFDSRTLAKETLYTNQISGMGKLKSALSKIDDVLFKLKLPTTFSQRVVEGSPSNFSVEAGTAAQPASYDIKVEKLAAKHQIASLDLGSGPVGAGSLAIRTADQSKAFSIDVGSADTIEDVRNAINQSAGNFGVTATVVNGDSGKHLILSSDEFGENNVLEIGVIDDDGSSYDNSGLSRLTFDPSKTVLEQNFSAGEVLGSNGDITLNNGTDSATVNIVNTDTIEDIVTKINNAGINVNATLEDDGSGNKKLVLDSANPYGNNAISISIASDDDGNTSDAAGVSKLAHTFSHYNYNETAQASDAKITVNGTISATSSSNTFDEVVDGLSITVSKAHKEEDSAESFSIKRDKEGTQESLTEFVDAFNEMLAVVKELTFFDENKPDETGELLGDPTLRTMLNQLRNTLADPVSVGNENFSLSVLGITTKRDGTLEIDEKELKEAIDTDFDKFKDIFTGDGGIAKNLANVVYEYESVNGIIDNRITSINDLVTRLNEEKSNFNEKMERYEARLYSQYQALDLTISGLRSTGDYLTQQLQNLPGVVKSE